jgi:hypothetical protein
MTKELSLLKARLGISSNVRDEYLLAIINGIRSELVDLYGVALDDASQHQFMFIVDYATYRYQNKEESGAMPRHLQFRLHNLIVGGS